MSDEDFIFESVNEFAANNELNRKSPLRKARVRKGIAVSFIRVEGRDDGGLKQELRLYSELDTDMLIQVVVDDGKSSWIMKGKVTQEGKYHSVVMCLGKGSHSWYIRRYIRSIDQSRSSKALAASSTSENA